VDDVGFFVASGHVITCDPRGVVLDNQLGEDHVEMNILYYPNNVSTVMKFRRWSLAQTIGWVSLETTSCIL
jgi:hypothetical protein